MEEEQLGKVGAAVEERKFSTAKARIDNVLSELHVAVDATNEKFDPVLSADEVVSPPKEDPANKLSTLSGFEQLVNDTENAVRQAVNRLKRICERSVV